MSDAEGGAHIVSAVRAAAGPVPVPPPPAVDAATGARNAAVLLLCDPAAAGVPLLFIRRSLSVPHHPGQIAFPGGGAEEDDGGLVGTALREASEEVGVDASDVEVLGVLPPSAAIARRIGTGEAAGVPARRVSGVRVDPVVALARRPLTPRADGWEVAEAFWVPLTALLDAPVTTRTIPGVPGIEVHFIEIDGRIIWGATAAMVVELLGRMRTALAA
ncbi:MAG TPA: CoA pyrophosphatase [Candidatus Dormibacteraeota bacterium]|nr:CoA pyrophosphatase [Candidatus Dormibacteraeota bacterium]